MRMPIPQTIAAIAGAVTLAVGGAAYAAAGHHHPASHTVGAKVRSAATAAEVTSPDTDGVQSGDQTTPDTAANVQTGEAGSGSEVTGADGPGGHADEPAAPNADHQFQGQE